VASRVNSYRARRKDTDAGQDSLALDFDKDAEAPSADLATASLKARKRASAPNAFDTNYYRRLNAASLSTVATRQESEAGFEAEDDPAMHDALELELEDVTRRQEASLTDEADDLEFQTVAYADAGHEACRIADAEPATLFEEAGVPSGAAPAAGLVVPAQDNLIVFPRPTLEPPLLPQPSRDELAEPVGHRPRILEVPEDIMPATQGSLFPEIRLDADEPDSCAGREPEIEVPLQVAPVSARLTAALTDGVLVLAAGALFGAIACRALPEVPHTKPFWMVMAGVTVLLWAVYQHLFLLYAGRTVGMSMRGIHLSTFDGRAPEWAERRRRTLFILLSFASVNLGFLWALVDEDTLCWHDRLSQTFPTTD
jgi:uncharacterized RDD family membrane protein YckC